VQQAIDAGQRHFGENYLQEALDKIAVLENAKQNDIALKIDTALNTIENDNPSLKGALPDNYFFFCVVQTYHWQISEK
jgi:type I restriction-modification system DNA methylase subunit